MPFSTQTTGDMLNWYFTTGAAPTRPTTWFASLHTANPGNTGASELTATNGYARQSVGTMTITSSNQASNAGTVSFTASGGAWATVSYAGLWTASTAGNFLAGMQLVQQGTNYALAAVGVVAGGSGYVVNDTVTVVTGVTATVTAVATGVVTGLKVATAGSVAASSLPTEPVATTGGTGTGLTVDTFWTQATSTYT